MSDNQQNILNEDQRRVLSSRLGRLERQLYDMELLLAGEPPRGAMFEVTNDFTPEETAGFLALLGNAREHIETLRDRFDLSIQREDVRRHLAGYFSIIWTILEDSHAAKLKGKGEVTPELEYLLDPEMDKLIEIVDRSKSIAVSTSVQTADNYQL